MRDERGGKAKTDRDAGGHCEQRTVAHLSAVLRIQNCLMAVISSAAAFHAIVNADAESTRNEHVGRARDGQRDHPANLVQHAELAG